MTTDEPLTAAAPAHGAPRDLRALPDPADPRATAEAILFEVRRVIVGQDAMLERILVGLLAGGHILLEGVPGLAKTLTIKTLADVLGGIFKRVQFTPDLMPSDLVGTRIYRPDRATFDTELGPVFANFLLADEINRAPAKVQSALLEVMQEHQVTIGGTTYPSRRRSSSSPPRTRSRPRAPIRCPRRRSTASCSRSCSTTRAPAEEAQIVARSLRPGLPPREVLDADGLLAPPGRVDDVYVDPRIVSYAVGLVEATRKLTYWGAPDLESYVSYGASPRGSINLIHGARALAVLRGRRYVLPSRRRRARARRPPPPPGPQLRGPRRRHHRRHDHRPGPDPRAGAAPRPGGGADRMTDLAPAHPVGRGADAGADPGPGPIADDLVRRLEVALTRRVGGRMTGDHRGRGLGEGLDLDRIRAYEPGDDVRRIDWNATARSLVPQVREDVPGPAAHGLAPPRPSRPRCSSAPPIGARPTWPRARRSSSGGSSPGAATGSASSRSVPGDAIASRRRPAAGAAWPGCCARSMQRSGRGGRRPDLDGAGPAPVAGRSRTPAGLVDHHLGLPRAARLARRR